MLSMSLLIADQLSLSYGETQIDANTPFGVLRIRGQRLTLVAMTGGELRIGGQIDGVEWMSC